MEVKEWISNKIKQRLRFFKLKNQDFAELMGVSPPRVTQWLSGDHNFTIETLVEIEKALNIKFFANETEQDAQQRCFPCITEKLF